MVQKRMTRSLILLSFVLDVRRVEGHAHYSYPRHHSRNSQMCFRTLEWKKSNCEAMEEGDSQVSVLEFYAACLVSATLAKYESLLVPSENRALVYFSHVVFCICQILPIFHSLQSYFGWQSVKIEVEKNMTISSVMHRVNQLLVLQIFLCVRKIIKYLL